MDKPNPYITALGTVGLLALVIGGIMSVAATSLLGLGVFILGALATVAWLAVQAVQWVGASR